MAARWFIAVDAMSGDEGPAIVVPAILNFLEKHEAFGVYLVGNQSALEALLISDPRYRNLRDGRLLLEHADSVVQMDDKPTFAWRNKQDSSMAHALRLVKSGSAHACLSAGNTGALMIMSRAILGTYPGIDRPAITKIFPSKTGGTLLLDLGANVDCSAEQLLQFAVMGQALAQVIKAVDEPTVALLNVGGESIKGNEQVRLAASLIRDCDVINYVGFAEGGDIFRGAADVVVCDGFVGNVALKSAEGAAKIILQGVREFFSGSWYRKLLGRLMLPLMGSALKQLDPDTHNGAIFLGLQGVVVKSHGNASASSFEHAMALAAREVETDCNRLIAERLDDALLQV
ncbi:MAG: phosphate acyltransferase PlsX [Oleiphilaceae bacterium]|nr:phosphate acyltransferase PlsX [Oleiphilaceae bacterium]